MQHMWQGEGKGGNYIHMLDKNSDGLRFLEMVVEHTLLPAGISQVSKKNRFPGVEACTAGDTLRLKPLSEEIKQTPKSWAVSCPFFFPFFFFSFWESAVFWLDHQASGMSSRQRHNQDSYSH